MNNAKKLIEFLIDNNLTITTAESCTGGMISSTLVDIDGASNVLHEAHVTYANEAKVKYLEVSEQTIIDKGVVSYEVAKQMAYGSSKLAHADVAISVTGYAGSNNPCKAEDDESTGLVYIGCFYNNNVVVEQYRFKGNRMEIRQQATEKAIDLALNTLGEKI